MMDSSWLVDQEFPEESASGCVPAEVLTYPKQPMLPPGNRDLIVFARETFPNNPPVMKVKRS